MPAAYSQLWCYSQFWMTVLDLKLVLWWHWSPEWAHRDVIRKARGSDMPAWLLLQLPCWMSLARPKPSLSTSQSYGMEAAWGWRWKMLSKPETFSLQFEKEGRWKRLSKQRHIPYSLRSSVFMPINQSGSKSLRSKWFLILWKLAIHASKHLSL